MPKSEIIGGSVEPETLDHSLLSLGGNRFSTADQPEKQRLEWLKEVIGREYANVEITPPREFKLYNDMLMYPWEEGVRLSPIRSNPIVLERLPQEPTAISHDCYFVVVLTSGQYKLRQGRREVYLQQGEMTFYDATQPHHIEMPTQFTKVLISIPKQVLHQRLPEIGNLTATKIPADRGVGAVASTTIQSIVEHLHEMEQHEFLQLSDHVLDLFTLSVGQISNRSPSLSRHRELTLRRVKGYIAAHIGNHELSAARIAEGIGLSVRYINNLFSDENTSLMRYLTRQRLELSRQLFSNAQYRSRSITEIAMHCGFKNMAHFSRAFKQAYSETPRQFRASL